MNKVLLAKLTVFHKINKFLEFSESLDSLGYSKQPTISPHPQPDGSIPQSHFFKSNFNIILPSTRFLPRCLWLSRFPTTTSYGFPFSPTRVMCYNYILLVYVFSLPLSKIFSDFLPPSLRLHSNASSASSSILLSPFSVIVCLPLLLLFRYIQSSPLVFRTTLQTDRSRVRFPMVPFEFISDIFLPVALCLWGRFSL